jgi:hypothetical protein
MHLLETREPSPDENWGWMDEWMDGWMHHKQPIYNCWMVGVFEFLHNHHLGFVRLSHAPPDMGLEQLTNFLLNVMSDTLCGFILGLW